MNNKTKKEILSNCTVHNELLRHLPFDISTLCFEYLANISDHPLYEAIIRNDIQLLRYLVSKDIYLCKEEVTALMWAAYLGKDKCVAVLANTKEVGEQTKAGQTAWKGAASNGQHKCVEILAKTKELGMKDKNGWSALMIAEAREFDKCVELLNSQKRTLKTSPLPGNY